jgi:dihydrofolate synthase/folylpolyglutamate synthase
MSLSDGGDPVSRRLAEVGLEWGHGMALELDRINLVLERLGQPHRHLAPVVHVAGTNGKGSTCAFLRAIAEAAGLRAHAFTSPHLVRPNERIRLAGALVSDAAFLDAIERIAATGATASYFEVVTAAALLLFAETPADLVVLEVGLGGRLDATNVVPPPAAAVIAPVDLDHQHILGRDIATIAAEKAGILKPGAPAVIARQAPEGQTVIEARAAAVGADLFRCGVEWDAWAERGRLIYREVDCLLDLPPPALPGAHQFANAGLAIAALRRWGDPRITDAAIASGVAAATWPARLQRLTTGPLASIAAARGCELWLDGAHNPHAAGVAAQWLAAKRAPGRPAGLVCGVLTTKDAIGVLEPFRGEIHALRTVEIPHAQASFSAEALASLASEAGLPAAASPSLDAAVAATAEALGPGGLVLIVGSLYLAGVVLADAGGVA